MAPTIHSLLELPEAVRKGDFVQSLASGILEPAETVKSYAVTSGILQTFEHALGIVDSALKTGNSQAAYLHGSFGSGKSHFMAILHLMLANHEVPWNRPEFHSLKARYPWIGSKKLLQLPMHFLNATSIEEKLFGTYVEWTREHHPTASLPALYANRELFENAQALRARMGDEAFFEELNSAEKPASRWGGELTTWNAENFAATLLSTDHKERDQLFSDLVKTILPAFAGQTRRFIELDRGLQVLARHAQGLGYEGVVLYLDELILWLAGSSSDLELIQREAKKLVNLKEGQHDRRAIPIVSFIARQRDLSELVGEQARGNERAALEDSLKHHQGRFETVVLEDSNLAAIVEHRVVRAQDAAARETLSQGFDQAWRSAGGARSTLIGSVGDEEAFRKVYPFSPALVEALVALSNCLQRERTAIRILMELLVDHLPELELGPVVPVGDAFDVIAGGEDPFDQLMRARFHRARHLYQEEFLPLLRADHKTDNAAVCQRLRPDHPQRLGCSGCPQTACRNDNRLAKTLLMAALVPGAPTFKGLTVRKLVHLNHGAIASPIPGAEVQLAAEKLRRWSAQVGALRVGDQADPELALHLESIDLAPVLDKARSFAELGPRKQALRRLLFEALELPPDASAVEYAFGFRGIRRKGMVRYGNVREMSASQLQCPPGVAWYLIIDYPFDKGNHSPADDLRTLEDYREKSGGREEPTLVWLPTFFSHDLERTLEDYVAIDYILDGRQKEYLGHLRQEDQIQARGDLISLRDQKRDQILRALAAAYGLTAKEGNPALDLSRDVEHHILPLSSSLVVRPLLAGSLKAGLHQALEALLGHLYPHQPRFPETVTAGKLERVRQLLERLLESPDRRMPVTAQDRKDLRAYADPLGLTQTLEQETHLREAVLDGLDQYRERAGLESPTVADVRGYTDPEGHRGLTPELQDLLLWVYLVWSARGLVLAGRDVGFSKLGQLPEEAELVRPELPTEVEWHEALRQAGDLFGVTFPHRHLNPRNLAALHERLAKAAERGSGAADLVHQLEAALRTWSDQVVAPRLLTAQSAADLVQRIQGADKVELVRRLAAYRAETSATAVSRSLRTTDEVVSALATTLRWQALQAAKDRVVHPTKGEAARQIMAELAATLSSDELNKPLAEGLRDLAERAMALVRDQPQTPAAAEVHAAVSWRTVARTDKVVRGGAEGYRAALVELAADLAAQAAQAVQAEEGLELELVVHAELRQRPRGEG